MPRYRLIIDFEFEYSFVSSPEQRQYASFNNQAWLKREIVWQLEEFAERESDGAFREIDFRITQLRSLELHDGCAPGCFRGCLRLPLAVVYELLLRPLHELYVNRPQGGKGISDELTKPAGTFRVDLRAVIRSEEFVIDADSEEGAAQWAAAHAAEHLRQRLYSPDEDGVAHTTAAQNLWVLEWRFTDPNGQA